MEADLKSQVIQLCVDNLSEDSQTWFKDKLSGIDQPSNFFLSFGMVNRKIERHIVCPNAALTAVLRTINPAFDSDQWTLDEFCRLAFLLSLPIEGNLDRIKRLVSTADIKEQVTIYKSIQYLPNAETFQLLVIDGIRTNMVDVFDAITANNSYAMRFFTESAWNQMVLKSIFMERPIFRIMGIDDKRNEKLALILHDFVHERWSAHRPVTPELWRMMIGYINADIFGDLKKAANDSSELARIAAIKVMKGSDLKEATEWLNTIRELPPDTSWDEIGRQVFQKN